MKSKISLFMTPLVIVFFLAFVPVVVNAAGGSVRNPEEIDLYYLQDLRKEVIGDIPQGYATSYQINVDGLQGTTSYTIVSGESAVVSQSGVITPKATTWYHTGNMSTTGYIEGAEARVEYKSGLTTIRVTCGDYVQDISVNVIDYADIYADNKTNEILAQIITDDMSDLDKLTAITKWVGDNTDYNYRYQSWQSMMIFEGGDCWSSTDTILVMCKKVGINARSRRGSEDPGAGTNHLNVVAKIDGSYYVADAGFVGNRPRGWSVEEEPGGFSVYTSVIYQYDGDERDVVIPSEINGRTITIFGNGAAGVFRSDKVESVHIPATITDIKAEAFKGATGIREVTVDDDNPNYCTVDGILYSKDLKQLVFIPPRSASVNILEDVEEIGPYAITGCNLDRLVIPSNVKTLCTGAFWGSNINELIIEEGLEHLESYAFSELSTPNLVIPASLKSMDVDAFYRCNAKVIVLSEGIGVTEIPEEAFFDADVTKLFIPEGVTSIGPAAFMYCYYLHEITLPATITNIAKKSFDSCPVKNIYFSGSESQWNNINIECELPSDTEVRCSAVRVTGIEAKNKNITLVQEGQSVELDVAVFPENADNKKITYESDNMWVAYVTDNVVTAYSEGECTVTAKSDDGCYEVEFKITVSYPRCNLKLIDSEICWNEDEGKSEAEYVLGRYINIRANKKDNPDGLTFVRWEYEGDNVIAYGNETKPQITIIIPDHDLTIKAVYEKVDPSTEDTGQEKVKDNQKDNEKDPYYDEDYEDEDEYGYSRSSRRKKAQNMVVKTVKKTVNKSKLKKKARKVKPITVMAAIGTVRYEICGGNAKSRKALKINANTGKITVKKKTKKGTYKVNVKVTASGNNKYKSDSKIVTLTIKVR